MEKVKNNTAEREIKISRMLSAPIELVWEVWTNPEHIIHWWGPNGFTTSIHKMDAAPGGEWLLTMHGPDGKNYPNRSIFEEIIPKKKIVFRHFNPDFTATIEFESRGSNTLMNWQMLFETKEIFETVVKTFKADNGLKQNGDKLENYLLKLKQPMKTIFTKDASNKKMNVTREFSAPVEKTWAAWTKPEMLDQWWAPKPWRAETKSMDFKEGGTWLYCMVGPGGERHWARVDYKKITVLKSFNAHDSFSDEKGSPVKEPPGMDWKVEFNKTNSGTQVQVEITFASEKDLNTIVAMGFEQGFAMAHDNLDELLSK